MSAHPDFMSLVCITKFTIFIHLLIIDGGTTADGVSVFVVGFTENSHWLPDHHLQLFITTSEPGPVHIKCESLLALNLIIAILQHLIQQLSFS